MKSQAADRKSSQKVVYVAVTANLLIAFAKGVGAVLSRSSSLGAEAIHSFVDTGNQILLLIGERKSRHPPTERHPLGHGREAFFWSFQVALFLFAFGGIYSIYDGIKKLESHEMTNPFLSLGILITAAIIEAVSLKVAVATIRTRKGPMTYYQWFKASTSPDLLVVFAEELADMAGIGIATLGVILSWITHDHTWDALGAIGVGIVLVIVAVALAREIKSLIIGEAPKKNYRAELNEIVAQVLPGAEVKNLIAVQTGTDEVVMSYKITRGNVKDALVLVQKLHELEVKVRRTYPEIRWQFISPVPR